MWENFPFFSLILAKVTFWDHFVQDLTKLRFFDSQGAHHWTLDKLYTFLTITQKLNVTKWVKLSNRTYNYTLVFLTRYFQLWNLTPVHAAILIWYKLAYTIPQVELWILEWPLESIQGTCRLDGVWRWAGEMNKNLWCIVSDSNQHWFQIFKNATSPKQWYLQIGMLDVCGSLQVNRL